MPKPHPDDVSETSVVDVGAGIDPDVDLRVSAERREWTRHRDLLPVIAVGGMVGASARYAVAQAIPAPPAAWPWATLLINATGCFLLGLLMAWVVERGTAHPLVRPFLGVGVLGGYTTFSTYVVEGHGLLETGSPLLGLVYLWGTVVVALLSVAAGAHLGRFSAARLESRRSQSRVGGVG